MTVHFRYRSRERAILGHNHCHSGVPLQCRRRYKQRNKSTVTRSIRHVTMLRVRWMLSKQLGNKLGDAKFRAVQLQDYQWQHVCGHLLITVSSSFALGELTSRCSSYAGLVGFNAVGQDSAANDNLEIQSRLWRVCCMTSVERNNISSLKPELIADTKLTCSEGNEVDYWRAATQHLSQEPNKQLWYYLFIFQPSRYSVALYWYNRQFHSINTITTKISIIVQYFNWEQWLTSLQDLQDFSVGSN